MIEVKIKDFDFDKIYTVKFDETEEDFSMEMVELMALEEVAKEVGSSIDDLEVISSYRI